MVIAVTIIHFIVCIGLILVVLLQTGKGAEIGAVFGGGSSSTIFGSSGAGNFLTKLTTAMAIVFMITSLALGYFAGQRPTATIFDQRSPAAQPDTPTQSAPPIKEQSGPTNSPDASVVPTTPKETQPQKSTNP
ncbi:MAG: preprotein translocase subunit SecG [Deltaproteobacteria bacterium]|nr:preprotein translocase subunit SecG [Deltaproteobacteria bacterium]